MTEQELHESRIAKWRLDGRPLHTLEDATAFLESVGFCLMYPLPPQQATSGAGRSHLPTFVGAYVGAADNLPTWQHVYRDPRAQAATELMVRLLRARSAYEANLFADTPFLVSASLFPYFYALVGDRNPRHLPKTGSGYSPLSRDLFEAIQKHGPISKPRLAEVLGGSLSAAALDRHLNELWAKLRITRVDYNPTDGAFWDILFRWSPDVVRQGIQISDHEALSALLSKYLDCVLAADELEITDFFALLVPRSKVKEALNALLATREFSFVHLGKRTLIQMTPARGDSPRNTQRRDTRPRPKSPKPEKNPA